MGQNDPGGGDEKWPSRQKEPPEQRHGPATFQLEWDRKENDPLISDGFWGTVAVKP